MMRGIGQTFSRLSAARAIFTGAMFVAGAAVSAAHAQGTPQTAMAVPRTAPPGAEVAFPQPLSPSEAVAVRRIFALQREGRIAAAERVTATLSDRMLLGSILADRYLGPYTVTTPGQLEDWLQRFGDQASAPAIYALLLHKLPRGAHVPPAPHVEGLPAPLDLPGREVSMSGPVEAETDGISGFAQEVAARASEGEVDSALALINSTRGLTTAHVAVLKAVVARALFTRNDDEGALALASAAARASGGADGAAAYVGGLAAWRLGRIRTARHLFRSAAEGRDARPPLVAAAAFWAARAELRLRQPKNWLPWMERAAAQHGCFYGLLAARMLGFGFDPEGGRPTLGEADLDAVAATDAGWRAFALLEVGQTSRAEAELASLWPRIQVDHTLGRAVMLVASRAGLLGLAARLSELLSPASGYRWAGTPTLPLPPFTPAGGFVVDPALVYALIRLESNFKVVAVSAAGARGLMQLMPDAAAAVTGHWGSPLDDPGVNLELGQRYMQFLAGQGDVHQSLLRVLGSYNSGPVNFAAWARDIRDQGDPLLFIEAIPNVQTRHFVEAALAYTWLYAARLGLPVPSLDALAEGRFPRFTAEADASIRTPAEWALH